MNFEELDLTHNNQFGSKGLATLSQKIFSILEEMFDNKSNMNIIPEELSLLIKNFLTLAKASMENKNSSIKDENKVFLEINKDFLKNFFLLLGKEVNMNIVNSYVGLLGIMMGSNSSIISPLSWEHLLPIIENEVSGDNDILILKALSKMFHILPSIAVKRLIDADFFEFIKILFESIEDDISGFSPLLFHVILEFLLSTKLNIPFQKALIQNKIHQILYKILKAPYQSTTENLSIDTFIQENRKLFIEVIVNCLSKGDKDIYDEFMKKLLFDPIPIHTHKFQEEVLSPILYTNALSDVVPVHVHFQEVNVKFEDLCLYPGQNDDELKPLIYDDDLFKRCLNSCFESEISLYWNKLSTFPKEKKEYDQIPCFLFEFTIGGDSLSKLIVLIISESKTLREAGLGRVVNDYHYNYLYLYENNQLQFLANFVSFAISNLNPLKPQINLTLEKSRPIIQFYDHMLTLKPEFFNLPTTQTENIKKFQVLLEKDNEFFSNLTIWKAFPIHNINQFENNSFKQFNSLSFAKNEHLFLLPSRLTLEEFLIILFKNDLEKIKSLRLSLNQKSVGMHIKLSDLITKEKSDFLEISIKSFDNKMDSNLILPPEEVLEVALIKTNCEPWNLISRCSYFTQYQLFLTLQQMVANISNESQHVKENYSYLSEKIGPLIPALESLFGKKLYCFILWFLFNQMKIVNDKEVFLRTILYCLANNDLKQCLPVDLFALIHHLLSDTISSNYQLISPILGPIYELGLIRDQGFIQFLIDVLVWNVDVRTRFNFQIKPIFDKYSVFVEIPPLMNNEIIEDGNDKEFLGKEIIEKEIIQEETNKEKITQDSEPCISELLEFFWDNEI